MNDTALAKEKDDRVGHFRGRSLENAAARAGARSALGDRRANEAKKFLIGLGVSADKIDTLSKGSEEAAKGAKGADAAKDRKVELVLLVPGASPAGMGATSAGAAPMAPAAGGMSAPTKP